jgi:hypothetical protein
VIAFTFAGVTREAYLASIAEDDTDMQVKLKLSAMPTGGGYTIDLMGRRIDSSNSYRGRVEVKADGQVIIRTIAYVGGAENVIASQTVSGLTYTQNMVLNARVRFVGTSPTTVEMKLWQEGSGEPGTWTLSNTDSSAGLQTTGAAGVRATSSNDAGTLNVTFDDLTITDGNLLNATPTVNAGTDQSISLPNTALMAATVTDDSFPGNPLTRTWSQISGPGTATFSPDVTVEDPTVSFTQTGVYVLQLEASDTEFTVNDTVTITVTANTQPVVEAGSNQTINFPDNTANMAATVTDNVPTSYTLSWSVDSAPGGATYSFSNAAIEDPVFTATNNTPGTYILRLTANDGEYSVFDTVTITWVLPANAAPVVDVGANKIVVLPDNSTSVNATVTDDGLPIGASVSYLWEQLSGPSTATIATPTAEDTNITFPTPTAGTYTFRLSASDTDQTGTDTVTVTVQSNGAPEVDAGLPQIISLPNSVFLNATVTDDGKLIPYTVTWSKVSGPGTVTFSPGTGVEDPQASFSVSGTYVLQLAAYDGEFTASDTVTITVNANPNITPTLTPTQPPNAKWTPEGVAFYVRLSAGSPMSQPVYRFRNERLGIHFYTASETEKNNTIANFSQTWVYEGIPFYVSTTQEPDLVPVYRFRNTNTALGNHFYTASETEKNNTIANYSTRWQYEGIAFFVSVDGDAGYSQVFRFGDHRSNGSGSHFYTASDSEQEYAYNLPAGLVSMPSSVPAPFSFRESVRRWLFGDR